ncbi:MAG TPA: hypothetical protein VNE39_08115 [Planctomycetota bacterium]|nr:hypothetical protein [Planctomycetota bacterium]
MSKTVTVDELARNLPGYITEVADRGEHVFLTRGADVVAELRPVPRSVKLRDLPRLFDSLPHLSDEDAEAFARDVEAGRAEMNKAEVRDPWET